MYVESSPVLCTHLKPICPRDGRIMKYQPAESPGNFGFESSYHCGSHGCSVRYNARDGYFILNGAAKHTYVVQEPGANTLQCPIHNKWLHRSKDRNAAGANIWRCGVKGCNFVHDFASNAHGETAELTNAGKINSAL